MIIKQTRIPGDEVYNLKDYFETEGENEEILGVFGSTANMESHALKADLFGKPYATRHIMISPAQKLTREQFIQIINEIVKEFEIPASAFKLSCSVAHKKPRETGQAWEYHFHIAVPETLGPNRALSSGYFKHRNEKLSRFLELKFGHPITVGSHNRTVYLALEAQGVDVRRYRDALISESIAQGNSIAEAETNFLDVKRQTSISVSRSQFYKRRGINLIKIARDLRKIIRDRPRILHRPRQYARIIQSKLAHHGGVLDCDENTAILSVGFGEIKLDGLKRFLGIKTDAWSLVEIYLKELAIDEQTNKEDGVRDSVERNQASKSSGRHIDDFGGAARGREFWRRWRESIPKNFGYVGNLVEQYRQAAPRDDVADFAEYIGNREFDSTTEKTSGSLQQDRNTDSTEITKLYDIDNFELNDFNPADVKYLMYLAAAKLKQKSEHVPPAFQKPLVGSDSKLITDDFEVLTVNP